MSRRDTGTYRLHVARYRAAVRSRAPIEVQVALLPQPHVPAIWWVDLERIRHEVEPTNVEPEMFLCRSGDWHPRARQSIFEPFATSDRRWDSTHDTVRALFLKGQPYASTSQYEEMMRGVARNEPENAYWCRTVEEVDGYFGRLIAAFRSMERDGYLTQRELGGPAGHEVRIWVSADGRWCHDTGSANHRIKMAELLGIRRVGFLLLGVDPRWITRLTTEGCGNPHRDFTRWIAGCGALADRRERAGRPRSH